LHRRLEARQPLAQLQDLPLRELLAPASDHFVGRVAAGLKNVAERFHGLAPSLALRLAQLGRSVVLIEKSPFPRRHIGESLTGGVFPLLDVLGVLPQVEAAGFIKAPLSTVFWAGQLNSRESHGGYQIDRSVFDDLLLAEARSAGVSVKQPARLRNLTMESVWNVELQQGEVLRAKFVAAATGRNSILGSKKIARGAQTIALYSYWTGVNPEEGETLVEAGRSQWYWAAPLPDGTFNAAVFVDKENARKEHYSELISHSHLLSSRLRKGVRGEVFACDATAFVDEEIVTPHSINVGDAALTIDPLSSQGVQTAVGTAIHAAIVINTILDRSNDTSMAIGFYRRRIMESAQFHSRSAAIQYREHCRFSPSTFWHRRAAADIYYETPASNVLVSLDQLMRISPRAAFVQVPTATEKYVVESKGISLGDQVFSRIGDYDLSDLLSQITETMPTRDVLNKWSGRLRPNTALRILEWACHCGLVEVAP